MQPAFPKRIAILCNGELDYGQETKRRIASYPALIAVDGGTNHCRQLGLRPHLIIGDLDSSTPDHLAYFSDVPCKKFPIDKDKTDLELALEEFMLPAVEEATIFGALGKRVDHTLTNILLLSRFPGRLFIESKSERLLVIDRELTLSCKIGQTLSLIPLNGAVSGIYTEGLKWNLSNGILDKHFIGISNQTVDERVNILVEQGELLCCHTLIS